jgi:hypothetical protein
MQAQVCGDATSEIRSIWYTPESRSGTMGSNVPERSREGIVDAVHVLSSFEGIGPSR